MVNGGRLIPGSVDVDKLYPSLETNECAIVVREAVKKADIEVIGVNYVEVGRTVAKMMTQEEIDEIGIGKFCPKRRSKNSVRPGLCDTGTRNMKWIGGEVPVKKEDKMLMLGVMVGEMVKLCFEGHVYEFGGVWYLQAKGDQLG